nr:glycoside hydrolase family 32 protein [Armatimonas sp.]
MTEPLRPLFHFTAPRGWLNDPNGLIFHQGFWHLFYQHNPKGTDWGNMTWGHARSTDLLHWEHLPLALEPYGKGTIFSGSAVLDERGAAGCGKRALLLFYTFAGKPFDQRMAFSNDAGQTFQQLAWNPVLPNIEGDNRDPRVFWHAGAAHWCMALYVRRGTSDGIEFYTAPRLTAWSFSSRIEGFYECPECFELEGSWVLFGADGEYVLGQFDGMAFHPEGERLKLDYGMNFYAAQTWSHVPENRRVLIAWMRGGSYPGMPFNQQLSFPTDLTLREIGGQKRLCRQPIPEISLLWRESWQVTETALVPGCGLTGLWEGEAFDVEATLILEPGAQLVLTVRGSTIHYDAAREQLSCFGRTASMPLPEDKHLKLRVLCDRTSIEVFGGEGEIAFSNCFLPDTAHRTVALAASDGGVYVNTLSVRLIRA